ncbi:MAG: insulinase family protein [Candidatus Terrybacteria bacterium]|nr:insulinase family protein [Candidatus Terrybacteria bacterium]
MPTMYTKRKLRNGLRVLSVPMKGTRAVTVLVLIKTGSKYERKEISGVSHFLEHMCFKGSARFPTVRALTEALDRLGAEYNAFTGKEFTGFWVKVASENAKQALRIVSDMLKHPRFPRGEVERERGVVLEELNLYFDTPTRFLGDLWEKVLWGEQPAGRYIGGTPRTVRAIQHRDIVAHFRTYYRAPAMVVTLAGAIASGEVARIARESFRGIRDGVTPGHPAVRDSQRAPQVLAHKKKTDQTHIAVGFLGVSMTHPARYAIAVLATILGGTMSSRLFLLIRDRLGLAYSIRTVADFDTETGSFVTIAGVRNANAREAIDAILKEYRLITKQLSNRAEVRKAQEAMIGKFALGLEETDELAAYAATQEILLGRIQTPEEEIRAIRRVTPGAVREAARLLFRRERLNLALIGPDDRRDLWYRQLDRAFPR